MGVEIFLNHFVVLPLSSYRSSGTSSEHQRKVHVLCVHPISGSTGPERRERLAQGRAQ
jgi:hypothetical protein